MPQKKKKSYRLFSTACTHIYKIPTYHKAERYLHFLICKVQHIEPLLLKEPVETQVMPVHYKKNKCVRT